MFFDNHSKECLVVFRNAYWLNNFNDIFFAFGILKKLNVQMGYENQH